MQRMQQPMTAQFDAIAQDVEVVFQCLGPVVPWRGRMEEGREWEGGQHSSFLALRFTISRMGQMISVMKVRRGQITMNTIALTS